MTAYWLYSRLNVSVALSDDELDERLREYADARALYRTVAGGTGR